MNDSTLIIIRKYARAFMNVCGDTLQKHDLEAMESLVAYLKKHKKAFFYMNLPHIDDDIKMGVFTQLCDFFTLSDCFNRLIQLLLHHKRIYLLSDVLGAISQEYKERIGVIEFTIASSHELTQDEQAFFLDFLKRKTGKNIQYKFILDPSLIMGLKMYSQTLLWEYSLKRQLALLQPV